MQNNEGSLLENYYLTIDEPEWRCHMLPWERQPFFASRGQMFFQQLNQDLKGWQLAWCARIAFGEPIKNDDPRQEAVYDWFFSGLLEATPDYDIEDETNSFDDVVAKLFRSEYCWRIESLFNEIYFALESWYAAWYRFVENLYGPKQERTAAADYENFLNTSLYLLSCFTSDDLGSLDPLKTYVYLRDTFEDVLKVIRMLNHTYRKLPNISFSKKRTEAAPIQDDATLIRGMKIIPREEVGGILQRCFKKHLPEVFYRENREYILTEVHGLLDCAYSMPEYYYLLPFISAHVFSKFFEVSHDTEPKLDRLSDCHKSFPPYMRLYANHRKSRIFRNTTLNRTYQLEDPHPVIGFMDTLLYELYSPQLHSGKWIKKGTGGSIKTLSGQIRFTTVFDYEEQIQVNWLAFFLEQRDYMFDAKCLEPVCVLQKWEHVLNQFFQDGELDGSRLFRAIDIDCAKPADTLRQKTKQFLEELTTDIELFAINRLAVNMSDWYSAEQTFAFPEEEIAYRRIKDFISRLCDEAECTTPYQQKKKAEEVRAIVFSHFYSRIVYELYEFFESLTNYETLKDFSNAIFPDTPRG